MPPDRSLSVLFYFLPQEISLTNRLVKVDSIAVSVFVVILVDFGKYWDKQTCLDKDMGMIEVRNTFSGRFSSFCRATASPSAFDRHLDKTFQYNFQEYIVIAKILLVDFDTYFSRSIRWAMSFTCFSTSVNPYLFSMICKTHLKNIPTFKEEKTNIRL